MISGKITLHPEPEKHRYGSWREDDDYMYGGYQTAYKAPTEQEQAKAYADEIILGTMKGLELSARVLRRSGTQGHGTIIKIHDTPRAAWNYSNKESEPYKVTWDKTTVYGGGTFDYTANDLLLVSSPTPTEHTNNENIPYIHQSC